jgi:anti-sigma regulatory factor (Ser/Thr protein kinase)
MMALCREPRFAEDPPVLLVGLERNCEAPSRARATIEEFFESQMDQSMFAILLLLVSELVSNALVHSDAPPSSEILLRARLLEKDLVRVEVIDQGKGFIPAPPAPGRLGGGYGLYLLNEQTTRWGVDRDGGARVWFELPGRG